MNRTDIGCLIFLVSAFLAPEVPLVEERTASAGLLGLTVWSLIGGLNLPLARSAREAWFLAAASFAVWTLLVSIRSPLASLYAIQQLIYLVLGGLLLRAYAAARPVQFERILSLVAGLYGAALIISWWTGPFYPWQMGYYTRGDVMRAAGTSSSVNQAGAVAAVFCFFLMQRNRWWLAALCLTGMVATYSRSAFMAAAVGSIVLATHWFVFGRERRALMFGLTSLTALIGIGALLALQNVGFDLGRGMADTTQRLDLWQRGSARWQSGSSWELLVGHGMHTSPVMTSHNLYMEILADLGLIGLLVFGLFVIASLTHTRYSAAATAGLVAMLAHNLTERYLYHPDMIVMWSLCIATAPVAYIRIERPLWPTKSVRFRHGQDAAT